MWQKKQFTHVTARSNNSHLKAISCLIKVKTTVWDMQSPTTSYSNKNLVTGIRIRRSCSFYVYWRLMLCLFYSVVPRWSHLVTPICDNLIWIKATKLRQYLSLKRSVFVALCSSRWRTRCESSSCWVWKLWLWQTQQGDSMAATMWGTSCSLRITSTCQVLQGRTHCVGTMTTGTAQTP